MHPLRPPFPHGKVGSPRLERVLERSMMMCLLGLLRTERLAREMSAVTRVMEILRDGTRGVRVRVGSNALPAPQAPGLPPPGSSFNPPCPPPAAEDHSGSGEPAPRVLPAIKSMLQEVKQSFLHHVCNLGLGVGGEDRCSKPLRKGRLPSIYTLTFHFLLQLLR